MTAKPSADLAWECELCLKSVLESLAVFNVRRTLNKPGTYKTARHAECDAAEKAKGAS